MKLNLASGNMYMDGYVNLDIGDKDIYGNKIKVEVIHNLNNYPYPFEDNTFDEIQARAIIEHLPDKIKVWDELRRISKNGCKIHVEVPHFSGYTGYDDPTHYHVYSQHTASMIADMWGFKLIKSKILFSMFNKYLKIFDPIVNIYPRFYERFLANIFPSQMVIWDFEVVK